jgi:hypothetical protein
VAVGRSRVETNQLSWGSTLTERPGSVRSRARRLAYRTVTTAPCETTARWVHFASGSTPPSPGTPTTLFCTVRFDPDRSILANRSACQGELLFSILSLLSE